MIQRFSGCLLWQCIKSGRAFTYKLQFVVYVFLQYNILDRKVVVSGDNGEANTKTNTLR